MHDQIYERYEPFATGIMRVYRYLREDRGEFIVSDRLQSESLAVDDLMEAYTIDSFEEAISRVVHIQRLLIQLHEDGYLDQVLYDSVSKSTDVFKAYLDEQYGRVRARRETPVPQELYEQAVLLAREYGVISISLIQRRLKTSFARAEQILDQLEADGIVGPEDGAKPRRTIS